MSETPTTYRVAVMGGTGPQGKGLGYRFARAGHDGDAALPAGAVREPFIDADDIAEVAAAVHQVLVVLPYADHGGGVADDAGSVGLG